MFLICYNSDQLTSLLQVIRLSLLTLHDDVSKEKKKGDTKITMFSFFSFFAILTIIFQSFAILIQSFQRSPIWNINEINICKDITLSVKTEKD